MFGGNGGRSGVPRHLWQLTETLAGRARLTVVSDRDHGGYVAVRSAGAVHHQIDGLRSRAGPVALWRAWGGALRLVRGGQWDLIWLHERMPALMLRLALALGIWKPDPQTRIMMSYHGIPFDPGHRWLAAFASRHLERFLLTRCPPLHLVFLTKDMAVRLADVVGQIALTRHHVHVLPNSSNIGMMAAVTRDVQRNQIERHLVITGRAGYQKNYPLAARLMDHLPDNYVLTLCGTGTDEAQFQARIRRLVRPETRLRIRFAGSVDDVRRVLAAADCYLLTSRYEGLPIGAIEAFEAGLPLVLSAFEAAPDMVAAHPMALCLPLIDLEKDARQITRLTEEYHRNRGVHTARIRQAWRRKYPYDGWQRQVRRLMARVLTE